MTVNTLCYISTNLMYDNTSSLKTMLKFALFLLLGSDLSFFGNSLAITGSLDFKSAIIGDEVARVLRRLYNVF